MSLTDTSPLVSKTGLSRRFLLAAGGIFIVWMALVGTFSIAEILTGIVVSAGVAFLSAPHLEPLDAVKLGWLLPLQLLRYFVVFLLALVRANLDVARRVLAPRVLINPAVVKVHTELQSDLGRLWLANSITLTPGTLSVDVDGDTLLVHWIDVSHGTDLETATRDIAARFEAVLKEIVQ